ncbi:MAG: hypothetical protein HKN04_03565 [Rhodothermaceae bacterium]|nr:hypothetical protein [Rhodothermaceae bacterium]
MRLLVASLLALALALPAAAQAPAPFDLVINEIMYDPPSPQPSGNEWVELFNRSDQSFDLGTLRFADAGATTDVPAGAGPIEPGGYVVLVNDGADFAAAFPGVPFVEVPGFPALNNTGDQLAILVGETAIDAVPYEPSWGGENASLERIDPDGPSDDASNWATTTDPDAGTPGTENTAGGADTTPPVLLSADAIDATTVVVTFDEPVVAEPGDYSLNNGIGQPSAASSTGGQPEDVLLTLATPLTTGTTYTLTVTNVADPSGNTLASAQTMFVFGSVNAPEPGEIVINEIMYDPPSPQPSGNEWVELFNRSDQSFDLIGFDFQDEVGNPVPITTTSTPLAPGAYAVLVADGADFSAAFPSVPFIEVAGFPTLNNSGDRPALLFGGTEIDAVPYEPSWGGTDASLERIDPNGPSNFSSNWATTTDPDAGTPSEENSVFEPDVTPPALLSASATDPVIVDVFFSEPVDPITAGDPANYSIDGGIGQPAMADVAPEGDPTRVQLILQNALAANTSYTLTVSNIADLVGNILGQDQVTFFFGQGETPDPRDLVINEFLYNEPSSNNPAEWVELFNRSVKVLDLAAFTLGDSGGEANLSDASVFVQPGDYAVLVENGAAFATIFPDVPFVEVSGWRSLNNAGDAIVLRHESGGTVDSLFYDDSWGGEDASLERKDPDGPSSFAVNWMTTTDPRGGTPGMQNSVFQPDTDPPEPIDVVVSLDGQTLTVTFDEPLEASTVTPGAFTVTGPVSPPVTAATYTLAPDPTVTLALGSALGLGDYTLSVTGVDDLLGNTAQAETLAFSFEPDETPPALVTAFALSATTVEVRFSEPVTDSAADPASYTIDGSIGAPSAVVFPVDGDATQARLTLATALEERVLYTLTVSGVADPSDNVLTDGTATLFLGEGDAVLPGELVINEIMYDPVNGGDGEYVELLNRTAKLFDLRTLSLTDNPDETDALSATPLIIPPDSFIVLVADRDSFLVTFPEAPGPIVEASDFPGLNNDGDTLLLLYNGTAVDSVAYDPDWHRVELEDATGIALERIDPAGPPSDATNWTSSLDPTGGTPGRTNTVFVAGGEPPGQPGLTIDSPFDPDNGQSTAIRYTLETDAAVVRVRIFDGAGRLVRRLEDGNLSGPSGALLWDGRDENGRRLRIGIYVVLLEAVNVEGGTSEAHRDVVVLARSF